MNNNMFNRSNNNSNNNFNNRNFNRNKDLTQVFDERWNANKSNNNDVSKRISDFNLRMYGIKSKEEKRKELRDANSVESKVDSLNQRMNSAFSIYNNKK